MSPIRRSRLHTARASGFTLLELMLVLALIAVLSLLAWQGYGRYVKKAEVAACTKKMQQFGVAFGSYLADKKTWPQEEVTYDTNGRPPSEEVLWDWWYNEMKDFGIDSDSWYCPTDMRLRAKEEEIDEKQGKQETQYVLKNQSYIPAKFGFGFTKPFEYPNHPWMVERVGHEEGMNKLMPNGTVQREFNFKAIGRSAGSGK